MYNDRDECSREAHATRRCEVSLYGAAYTLFCLWHTGRHAASAQVMSVPSAFGFAAVALRNHG